MTADDSTDGIDPDIARKLERKGELKQEILHALGDAPGDNKTARQVQDEIGDEYDEGLYDEAFGELVTEQRVAGVNGFYWEAREYEDPQFLYDA